ncbi:hypothetical protein [Nocardioides sp. GXZ039]|uniref:hypothetical protein n=1 Tax=Nocardioides sp. GXZ039 TaxID=3136018 RepID=UPI0030F45011
MSAAYWAWAVLTIGNGALFVANIRLNRTARRLHLADREHLDRAARIHVNLRGGSDPAAIARRVADAVRRRGVAGVTTTGDAGLVDEMADLVERIDDELTVAWCRREVHAQRGAGPQTLALYDRRFDRLLDERNAALASAGLQLEGAADA